MGKVKKKKKKGNKEFMLKSKSCLNVTVCGFA